MAGGVMSEDGEDEVETTMNVIPLVDVMLVLLIIFLITIPSAISTVEVELPEVSNQVTETRPENIILAVDADGRIYWNEGQVTYEQLYSRIAEASVIVPQPEVHVRGDIEARFEHVGRVLAIAQRGGIMKVGFITDPETGMTVSRFTY